MAGRGDGAEEEVAQDPSSFFGGGLDVRSEGNVGAGAGLRQDDDASVRGEVARKKVGNLGALAFALGAGELGDQEKGARGPPAPPASWFLRRGRFVSPLPAWT